MLDRLYIENIAVIEQTEVCFDGGFNVLTGETGAGKSIIIDSINAVLGGRTSRELIRTGAAKAFVSAEFSNVRSELCAKAEELGFSADDRTLILSREIKPDGKTSCRINGRPATVAQLRQIGSQLINIHGQHETTALLDPETHIGYVDALAENSEILERYRVVFKELCAIRSKLNSINENEQEKARQADMLRYQIDELESARIVPGEYDELCRQRSIYRNFENINDALTAAHDCLRGDEESSGACEAVCTAREQLDSISDVLSSSAELYKRLTDVSYELEDIAEEIRNELNSIEFDPEALDEAESRLAVLEKLFKKYGDEEASLKYLEEIQEKLSSIENSDELKEKLKNEFADKLKIAKSIAGELTETRRNAGKQLCSRVTAELAYLDMPSVTLQVDIKEKPLSLDGRDSLELLISTNAGEPPKPLSKIASGGELSRIMLAFKTVLADKDSIDTLIFDEIDTGISGKASQKVGQKLKDVSLVRQIICVTHSAQIAAKGSNHMLIKKSVSDGRTRTAVTSLDREGRRSELARIIGGDNVTDSVLNAAEEMMDM